MRTLIVLIAIINLLHGCKKEEQAAESTEAYYFSGDVDGNPVKWDVKVTANATDTSKYGSRYHYIYSQGPGDCATTNCFEVAQGTVVYERGKGNAMEVLFVQDTNSLDLNSMKHLMTAGAKPYGIRRTNPFTSTQRGVIIRYTEGSRLWQSEIGDQTGSSFESVEFKPSSKEDKIHANVWKARFSCKVYFSGLAPKTLQNVEVYGRLLENECSLVLLSIIVYPDYKRLLFLF